MTYTRDERQNIQAIHYNDYTQMIRDVMTMPAEERAEKIAAHWEVWTMADGSALLCEAHYPEIHATDYSDELDVTLSETFAELLEEVEAMEEYYGQEG